MYNYLKQQGFKRGSTKSNLYLKIEDKNMIIVVVYVDDIIFGSNLQILSVNFASEVKKYQNDQVNVSDPYQDSLSGQCRMWREREPMINTGTG